MAFFVNKDSIVREIWGKADTILFIFAGASAEFALNRAVDWLYFTGKLPADPLARLFSTVNYARQIVFSDYQDAMYAIDKITAIHKGVEASRGAGIPDWAYRDVLFMLIYYSIRSYEVLERKLTEEEKDEVFDVFYRMGARMGISSLPMNYPKWLIMREEHLKENLLRGSFTHDLYRQYRKHLGWFRYQLLRETQRLVVPLRVNQLLGLGRVSFIPAVLGFYKIMRILDLHKMVRDLILPRAYKQEINNLG